MRGARVRVGCGRVSELREIERGGGAGGVEQQDSPPVVEPLESDSDDSSRSDTSRSPHDELSQCQCEPQAVEELLASGSSADGRGRARAPRETIQIAVNILFDQLFTENEIRKSAQQQEPNMVERALFAVEQSPQPGGGAAAEWERGDGSGALPAAAAISEVERGAVASSASSETAQNAKRLLSLNAELIRARSGGDSKSSSTSSSSSNSKPASPTVAVAAPAVISSNSISPALVKAIQDDVAHVLSENRVYVKFTNKVRPYHVTVVCLAELPAQATQGDDVLPDTAEGSVQQYHQQKHRAAAAARTMYELSLSVVLPRGVSEASVQKVVRQEVRDANSVWRRSAPPYYSLDMGYIREPPAPAPAPASMLGGPALAAAGDADDQAAEASSTIQEGVPPEPQARAIGPVGIVSTSNAATIGSIDSAKGIPPPQMQKQGREQQMPGAPDHDESDATSSRSSGDTEGEESDSDDSDSNSERESDGDDEESADDDEESDDDDEDAEESDDDEEDEAAAQEDPATQAFTAAISSGSSADEACVVGLGVICTMLHEGGVPQHALDSLTERARAAFRRAWIQGTPPLEAWRLVGESAESGALF